MSKRCHWAALVLAPSLILLTSTAVDAQDPAPDSFTIQGILTDTTGLPVADGSYNLLFSLYDVSVDGSPLWTENHNGADAAAVKDGLFEAVLGGMTSLKEFAFDRALYLGISVNGGSELTPRVALSSVPYARALPAFYTFYDVDGSFEGYNVVGGSPNNFVGAGSIGATIGGGGGSVSGEAHPDTVEGRWATVGGGVDNRANAFATVAGGNGNKAYGAESMVGGGSHNRAGDDAVVSGGVLNTASGIFSTVPGGLMNRASGNASFAAGTRAAALHDGSFVWADLLGDTLESTGPNQFLIRANGGVGIGTNSPDALLEVDGAAHVDGELEVDGPIHATGSTLVYHGTSPFGSSGLDDGARMRYQGDFGGAGHDYLVFEKTDANQNAPDGGIAFINTGADGVPETALQIFGSGSVSIPGNLTKGSGSFKIDHPLDPTNKFLYHSFVESPDMKNVYDGVITLDEAGEAEVELPSYFEALNRDFRYQLTCIGGFAPVYISRKILGNRFRIAGGRPGMEVSWQVTGIRHDPFAVANPIDVEVDKGPGEQGTYLHPAAYGASH